MQCITILVFKLFSGLWGMKVMSMFMLLSGNGRASTSLNILMLCLVRETKFLRVLIVQKASISKQLCDIFSWSQRSIVHVLYIGINRFYYTRLRPLTSQNSVQFCLCWIWLWLKADLWWVNYELDAQHYKHSFTVVVFVYQITCFKVRKEGFYNASRTLDLGLSQYLIVNVSDVLG